MEGSLGVGEYMQLNVNFEPKKVGDYTENLTVSYNTGKSQGLHIARVLILCTVPAVQYVWTYTVHLF